MGKRVILVPVPFVNQMRDIYRNTISQSAIQSERAYTVKSDDDDDSAWRFKVLELSNGVRSICVKSRMFGASTESLFKALIPHLRDADTVTIDSRFRMDSDYEFRMYDILRSLLTRIT